MAKGVKKPKAKASPNKVTGIVKAGEKLKLKVSLKTEVALAEGESPTESLFRRESDEQSHRCIKLKLGIFPQNLIQNNVFDGRCIFEHVEAKLKECKTLKRHIPLSFWITLIADFKLKGSLTEGLVASTEK